MLSPSSESSAAVPVPTAISQLERGYLSGLTDILRFQIIFFFFFLRDTVHNRIVQFRSTWNNVPTHRPSICHRPTFSRVAKRSMQRVVVVEELALAMPD